MMSNFVVFVVAVYKSYMNHRLLTDISYFYLNYAKTLSLLFHN